MKAPVSLIFEPHNGFGANDPDGNPWPFGYISSDSPRSPIFELVDPIGDRPTLELRALALKMAAVDELLAACVEFVRKVDAGEARSTGSYAQMKAAIAKANGE